MNGIIASIFFASSFVNPQFPLLNGLDKRNAIETSKVFFSSIEFQKKNISAEIGFTNNSKIAYGPWQPSVMVSLSEKKGIWGGFGAYSEWSLPLDTFVGFSFLPGIYLKGEEVDLGGWLMFRSGLEFGKYIDKNWVLSIAYDHRSSGDLWKYNPGMETWQLRFGRTFK